MPASAVPRVSVVTCTYNSAGLVGETVRALLAQTWHDFELIVVDDASTDGTAEVVAAQADPRIRLIRNTRNVGVAAARNIGMDAARGEYLFANDHDDVSLPTRLARQVAYLDRHPEALLVATGTYTVEGDRRRPDAPPPATHALIRWKLMTQNPICHSTLAMRLPRLRALGLRYDPACDFGDDFELCHRIADAGPVAALPERLVAYRLHAANASRLHADRMNERGRRMLAHAHRRFLDLELDAGEFDALWRLVTSFHAAPSVDSLHLAGAALERTLVAFLARMTSFSPAERDGVVRAASQQWWDTVNRAANLLGPGVLECYAERPALAAYMPGTLEHWRRTVGRVLRRARIGSATGGGASGAGERRV
jgi:glycosyltransferase involved in cell wall biosynthesis